MADCGPTPTDRLGLRVGAIFIILVTSLFGTLFPIASKRVPIFRRRVSPLVFEFAKFFGSGVILATGLIHLLEPASDELSATISSGGCIADGWDQYPFAFGICLASLFVTFVIQLVSFRLGTERLARALADEERPRPHPPVFEVNPHTNPTSNPEATLTGTDVEGRIARGKSAESFGSLENAMDNEFHDASEGNPAATQLLSVMMLEFGVVFHSVIIGLTLAVTGADQFSVLFIVIIFHQMFEGLGLGTRLAFLQLPPKLAWMPFTGAIVYSFITPLGMTIGLGVRETLSMSSGSANITAGVLDSISAGMLIYTATVELIAHEFIFNKVYHTCSWPKLWFSVISFALGAGIMALLGKWA